MAFPAFVATLGAPESVTAAGTFRGACLLAGFLVGACNYGLVRRVVARRMRLLVEQMRAVEITVRDAATGGYWAPWASDRPHVNANSNDELGEMATSFNRLVDALDHQGRARKELEETLRHQAFTTRSPTFRTVRCSSTGSSTPSPAAHA